MDSGRARELFQRYASAMAYVAVEDDEGEQSIGSAFHVGEGVFVTARHVVEDKRILQVRMTEHACIELPEEEWEGATVFLHDLEGERPVHRVENRELSIAVGPVFHPEADVDVAVFRVDEIDARTPYARLGDHLDDWLGQTDFVLTEAIVLGYPRIPMTKDVHLVAARAEVNAIVDLYNYRHVHLLLSAMPRGGFSGGLVVSEAEFVLGVVTDSLLADGHEAELGFFAVLSVEPIYACLSEHKMLPDCQAEGWDDFWNMDDRHYGMRQADEDGAGVSLSNASIGVFDDGKRAYLQLSSRDPLLLEEAVDVADQILRALCRVTTDLVREGMVNVRPNATSAETRHAVVTAALAVERLYLAAGLEVLGGPAWT